VAKRKLIDIQGKEKITVEKATPEMSRGKLISNNCEGVLPAFQKPFPRKGKGALLDSLGRRCKRHQQD